MPKRGATAKITAELRLKRVQHSRDLDGDTAYTMLWDRLHNRVIRDDDGHAYLVHVAEVRVDVNHSREEADRGA